MEICLIDAIVLGAVGNLFFIAPNGGDWRSKSLALLLKLSTILYGFYFANCVLAAVFFLFDYQHFKKYFGISLKKVCGFQNRLYICINKTAKQ